MEKQGNNLAEKKILNILIVSVMLILAMELISFWMLVF